MSPKQYSFQRMLIYLLTCLLLSGSAAAQWQNDADGENEIITQKEKSPTLRLNFYVITKDEEKKLDFFGETVILRARLRSGLSGKKLKVIVAENAAGAAAIITETLGRESAMIGSLWFDSHGFYKNGYSSFRIGSDEFSYKNIRNLQHTAPLQKLSAYCDHQSQIGIGSCYAGATFQHPGTEKTPSGRMNGDSLLIGLAELFPGATVYGSESWVMAKPGIFTDKFGLAGYPLNKRFRRPHYKPVWERLGIWHRYSTQTRQFETIPTVALNQQGDITIRARHYLDLNKAKKKQEKALENLAIR